MPVWLQALTSVAAIAVSVAAVWFSFLQYRIARATLQSQLLDKRMQVYDAVANTLRSITTSVKPNDGYNYHLNKARNVSDLICNAEISEYIEQFRKRAVELERYNWEMENTDGENRIEAISKRWEHAQWFITQADGGEPHQKLKKFFAIKF